MPVDSRAFTGSRAAPRPIPVANAEARSACVLFYLLYVVCSRSCDKPLTHKKNSHNHMNYIELIVQ